MRKCVWECMSGHVGRVCESVESNADGSCCGFRAEEFTPAPGVRVE